jgi:hypothetical protein
MAERFFDEAGGMQLIIHAPFGARIGKAWGLALRKRFCRSFNFELQAAALMAANGARRAAQLSLGDVFSFLERRNCSVVLEQAALDSPIFSAGAGRQSFAGAFALQGGRKFLRKFSECAQTIICRCFPTTFAAGKLS